MVCGLVTWMIICGMNNIYLDDVQLLGSITYLRVLSSRDYVACMYYYFLWS